MSGTIRAERTIAMANAARQSRTCILVLGMHRSGTSALTRVVSLLGAALPLDLNNATIGAAADHWEPLPLAQCHDAMLQAAGSRWNDWRAFKSDGLDAATLNRFKGEISGILEQQFGNAPLFVLKDPRTCRFIPLFRDILKEMDIAPRYVLALRNPLAVMRSLGARDDMAPGFAGLLWLRHVLDAERATRDGLRVIASYERLMADWRAVVADLTEGLGVTWPTPPQTAAADIDAFLMSSMQHHSFTDTDVETHREISAWIKETYKSMRLLEHDAGALSALATLDRVGAEFNRWGPVFGEVCFSQLAAHERRAAENLTIAEAERDAVRSELQATQATLQSLEAEREKIRRSRWWRIAERMRAFERRFRFRRKDRR